MQVAFDSTCHMWHVYSLYTDMATDNCTHAAWCGTRYMLHVAVYSWFHMCVYSRTYIDMALHTCWQGYKALGLWLYTYMSLLGRSDMISQWWFKQRALPIAHSNVYATDTILLTAHTWMLTQLVPCLVWHATDNSWLWHTCPRHRLLLMT